MTNRLKEYRVRQGEFEGPLDLLLELIEKKKLLVSTVSLAEVTDQYVAHVKAMEMVDREALAEFLVVAAQLMLLKSRSLLPALALTSEEEESIEDLERRLALYKKLKEAAGRLKELERRRHTIFSREAFLGIPALFYPPPKLTPQILADAFGAAIKTLPQFIALAEEKIRRIVSLEEKIREIHSRLSEKLEHAFSELVKGSKEKVDVIVSFLAILELARKNLVSLEQADAFRDITVRRVT